MKYITDGQTDGPPKQTASHHIAGIKTAA